MRVVFLASADIALSTFDPLQASAHELAGVITQPDRPAGRKRALTPCPAKAEALARGIPVASFEKIGSEESMARLAEWRPDILLVFAYGQYIPSRVVDAPPYGSINIHPSLLPRYRGAAPIQSAIANGDTLTGVSVIRVAKAMDAGDILAQQELAIDPEDTSATLAPRLAALGSALAVRVIDHLAAGDAVETPQDEAQATEVGKLRKEDGLLDWGLPARSLYNRIRAYDPWPGTFFSWAGCGGDPVKVWRARVEPRPEGVAPGTVCAVDGEGPLIACGEEALRLLELQPPGKRRMAAETFLHGHVLQAGDVL